LDISTEKLAKILYYLKACTAVDKKNKNNNLLQFIIKKSYLYLKVKGIQVYTSKNGERL